MKRISVSVLLFFFFYLLWNWSSLINACERGGDYSLILFETKKASEFKAFLGPYSRFHFHHPGPIVFYLYAIGSFIFGWIATPTGALYLTQLLINAYLIAVSFGVIKENQSSKFFSSILLTLFLFISIDARGGVLRDIWNPSVTYVSTFCFVIISSGIFLGNFKFLFPWVISFLISFSHHLGSVPIITLIGAISLYFGLKKSNKEKLTKRNILFSSAIFLFALSFPFLDAIKSPNFGNWGEIFQFFTRSKASHSIPEAFGFMGTYISPIMFGIVRDEIFLGAILIVVLFLSIYLNRNNFNSSEKVLSVFALLAALISVLSAKSAEGKLYNYLMMYLYGIFMIPFAAMLSLCLEKINIKAVYPVVLVLPFLLFPAHVLTVRPCRDDLESTLPKIVSNPLRPIKIYTKELTNWGTMATLVSKLYRADEPICVEKLWDFMFGADLVCKEPQNYSIEVSSEKDIPAGKEGIAYRKGTLIFSLQKR